MKKDSQKHTSSIPRGNPGDLAKGASALTVFAATTWPPTPNARSQQTRTTAVARTDIACADGNFSQGKISDSGAITRYAYAISQNWRRGVEAFLELGRLCAEAEERLDPAQQAELKAELPFSAATFSKFRQIGLDARLRKPEVQLLLPAAYTTIYTISCLKSDEDLNAAITEKIINPSMKRGELEKWWKEREAARQRQTSLPEDPADSRANPVSDVVDKKTGDVAGSAGPDEVPMPTVEASEPTPDAAADVTSPRHSVAQTGQEDISLVLGAASLSLDDQADLDLLNATWDRASDVVRTRFRARIGTQVPPV
jgi:hypothetical protein